MQQRMNLPNRLTLVRMCMVPLFVACFFLRGLLSWWNYLAAAVFFIADATDIIDGHIARKRGLITNFGKLMDPIADKLLFLSAFIMLCWLDRLHPILCFVFVAREIVIDGFRLVTAAGGTVIAANALGKIKATLQVLAILWTLLENPVFRRWDVPFDRILMCAAAIMSLWSALDYIIKNRRAVNW
ncbi:MAG: CDP-diacylglycerol--glycerol-3-phosphate 3-phosphatidyltransferase, partial [Clostridia bacterium]|nr:CDP-diacylglycerol--glycerol-3-phosphate 3-phosphatidyltransferase [Clostridia bacterium]